MHGSEREEVWVSPLPQDGCELAQGRGAEAPLSVDVSGHHCAVGADKDLVSP